MEFLVFGNLGDYFSLSPLPLKFLLFNRGMYKVPKKINGYMEEVPKRINGYWGEALTEILDVIVERLSLSDRIRMSIVCKYWRAIALKKHIPTIPQIPWLTLPQGSNSKHLSFLDISACKIQKLRLPKRLQGMVCCGTSKGWLVMAEDYPFSLSHKLRNYCDKVIQATIPSLGNVLLLSPTPESDIFLFNPISGEVHQLPSLFTIPCYQQFLDNRKQHNVSCLFRRIELSSANVSECIVAGAFEFGYPTPPMVAICRPGNKQWSIFTSKTDDQNFEFIDLLFCKRTLYVIGTAEHFDNYNKELAGCEVNLKIIPSLPLEAEDVIIDVELVTDDFVLLSKFSSSLYLVESTSNEMLLVKRFYDEFQKQNEEDGYIYPWYLKTSGFYVFKMDSSTGQWQRIYNIDDQVLFICYGGSSSVSAKDFAGVQGNCIYFAEDYDYCGDYPCSILSRECGVFYLQDGRIERSFPSVSLPFQSKISWFTPIP